jgi:hypothetical protein
MITGSPACGVCGKKDMAPSHRVLASPLVSSTASGFPSITFAPPASTTSPITAAPPAAEAGPLIIATAIDSASSYVSYRSKDFSNFLKSAEIKNNKAYQKNGVAGTTEWRGTTRTPPPMPKPGRWGADAGAPLRGPGGSLLREHDVPVHALVEQRGVRSQGVFGIGLKIDVLSPHEILKVMDLRDSLGNPAPADTVCVSDVLLAVDGKSVENVRQRPARQSRRPSFVLSRCPFVPALDASPAA